MKQKIPSKENICYYAAIAGTIICILIQVLILFCIHSLKAEPMNDIAVDSISADAVIDTGKATSQAIYRLYECGGKIGIYDAKSETIVDIIDIFVSTLPPKDIIALKKGINVYSLAELSKLVDDFST